jgi:hypothetical protein
MHKYHVELTQTSTLRLRQGETPHEPVTIVYTRTDDAAAAIAAVAVLLSESHQDPKWTKTLAVEIKVNWPEPPPWEQ